jgi:Uma2 family endonuclease
LFGKKGEIEQVATGITEKKKYTFEDYAKLPEGSPYQLIGGDLIMIPASTPSHQRISRKIWFFLLQHVEKNDLGEVFDSPIDVYFGDEDTFQPDLIFISRERSSNLVGETKIEGAPDLIIEIPSPSTTYYDFGRKFKVYEKAGVKEFWIVHPERKRIEVYQNRENRLQLIREVEETGIVKSVLLKGFEFEIEKVF